MVVAILGIGFLLRTHHLLDITMHFDECCSWRISQFTWPEMFEAISRDAHPPLYYIMLKLLTRVLGDSVLVLRGFAVAMGLATIAAAMGFTWTIMSSDNDEHTGNGSFAVAGALLSGFLIATSGLHVEMSMEARPYSLGTCLALTAAMFLLRSLRSAGTYLDWMLFTLSTLALSFTHYYCLFTILGYLVFAGLALLQHWWAKGFTPLIRKNTIGLFVSFWVIQFFWGPWFSIFQFQLARSTPQLWMRELDWNSLSTNLYRVIAGGQKTIAPTHLAGFAPIVWVVVCGLTFFSGNPRSKLAGICALTPIVAVVAYGVFVRNIIGVRYLIFAHTFLLIAAAVTVKWIPRLWMKAVFVLMVLSWSGYWCIDYLSARSYIAETPGLAGAVRYIDEHRRPGEILVIASPFVLPIVRKYTQNSEGIFTRTGDHRNNILSGPSLLDSDYRNTDEILRNQQLRVWTIDSYGMFSQGHKVEIRLADTKWTMDHQHLFDERNGNACLSVVRCYRALGH